MRAEIRQITRQVGETHASAALGVVTIAIVILFAIFYILPVLEAAMEK